MIYSSITCGSKDLVVIDKSITCKVMLKAFMKIEELINNSEDVVEHIMVIIDSEGGEIEPAFFLYDYLCDLKDREINVVTMAMGTCKSAAALVFSAGSERVCGPNTTFMIHDIVLTIPEEKATKEVLSYSAYTNYQSQRSFELIAKSLKPEFDLEYIENQVSDKIEWYFDGRGAHTLGLATVLFREEVSNGKSTEAQCTSSE